MSSSSLIPCRALLAKAKLVAVDVDGVLTDGRKYYGVEGLASLPFHARDGLGIYLLLRAGFNVVFITNDLSRIVRTRAADLRVTDLVEGVEHKGAALREIKKRLGVQTEETVYIGDDLWDLEAFQETGVRVAVADAVEAVRQTADWITQSNGGCGAVREVADILLEAKGIDPTTLLRVDSSHEA